MGYYRLRRSNLVFVLQQPIFISCWLYNAHGAHPLVDKFRRLLSSRRVEHPHSVANTKRPSLSCPSVVVTSLALLLIASGLFCTVVAPCQCSYQSLVVLHQITCLVRSIRRINSLGGRSRRPIINSLGVNATVVCLAELYAYTANCTH